MLCDNWSTVEINWVSPLVISTVGRGISSSLIALSIALINYINPSFRSSLNTTYNININNLFNIVIIFCTKGV